MKLRPALAAVLMTVVSVGSASSALAAPKKKAKAKPKAAPTKLAPVGDEPAATPDGKTGDQAAGDKAGEGAAPAAPAEEPPPDEKTMEGVDENPGAPKDVNPETAPVVTAPPPVRTGYPLEEVLRPLTLPEQTAEVAIDLRADIAPNLSGLIRGRYGITREAQIGLRYVLGTAFDPDGDTGPKGMEFRAGKAVSLETEYLIQDWVAAQIAVPLYFQPSAVGLVLGAPVKFRFGDKFALFGLNDLVEIKLYNFVPSLQSEQANVLHAAAVGTDTIIPDGLVRINAGAIVQVKPEIAVVGQTGVIFDDFDSTKLIYPLEALIQYSLSNKLDVVGRAGFDDLSDGDSFGVRFGAVFRI